MKQMKTLKKLFATLMAMTFAFGASSCLLENEPKIEETFVAKEDVKNVILLIGDGMGPNQIRAGALYKGEPLFMQTLQQKTYVETCSASDEVTDSAAAATALATGVRTNNGRVGIDPSGNLLETIVDIAKANGKRTGVITTEGLNGATPMGFSGHAKNRNYSDELLETASTTSNVDLFASYHFTSYYDLVPNAGYEVIEDVDLISESTADKVFGTYEILASAPSMSADSEAVAFDRLVMEALDYLSKDEDGFFLMAEGAHIDHGGHNNDIMYMLTELLAFDDMVRAVVHWAKERQDTLVLVTADHETGGLEIDAKATTENLLEVGEYGYEYFEWTTSGHTDTNVCFYAYGSKVNFMKYSSLNTAKRIKNTDINKIMKDFIIKA